MNKKSSPKENHYLSKLEHYISKAKHYSSIPCKTLSFKSKTLMFLKQNIIFQSQKIISQFHTKQPLGKFGAKEGCKIRNKTKCVKNLPRLINPNSPLLSSPLFSPCSSRAGFLFMSSSTIYSNKARGSKKNLF